MFTLAQIVADVKGELHGDVDMDLTIRSIATLKNAYSDELSFLSNVKYKGSLE